MKKSTVEASTDVALVKYWGKKNDHLRLPENGSLSIVLKGLDTVTTVEFSEELTTDQITIQGERNQTEVSRVSAQLDRLRAIAGRHHYAHVESINRFPKGTGLSSSGSGFAALTYAAARALELDLSQRELSILARFASGTACRCICGGFVEWKDGNTSDESYSETVFPANYWQLNDVVAVVDEGMKRVSSTEGHKSAQSSIFFGVRKQYISEKIQRVKLAIENRDFSQFGELVEAEALEFHSILLTSHPPLVAWYPGTVQTIQEVQNLRREGIEAYFTINTGFNVHVLTLPNFVDKVEQRLKLLPLVKKTLIASVGRAPTELNDHLF